MIIGEVNLMSDGDIRNLDRGRIMTICYCSVFMFQCFNVSMYGVTGAVARRVCWLDGCDCSMGAMASWVRECLV